VFYPSLLLLNPNDLIDGQRFTEPPPIIATEGDNEPEWLVDNILAIRRFRNVIKV